MRSDDPWAGLVPGGRNARRVDHGGRHDLFWCIMDRGEPALLLMVGEGMEETGPLPELADLDIRYQPVEGIRRALVIALREPEQIEIFATLCRDLVAAAETAGTAQEALERCIRRTVRWHFLLRGGRSGRLGPEEQRGLVGELGLLRDLIDRIGASSAIAAWRGPAGAPKDFELPGLFIEVKARRGAARPFVQISSEDQLADVTGARLLLRVVEVDRAVEPDGMTLTDHVADLDRRFRDAGPAAHALWEDAITAAGYSEEDDYAPFRWSHRAARHFGVVDGFPRLVVPLPDGVHAARYAIGLAACAPFEVDPHDVATMMDGLIHERA